MYLLKSDLPPTMLVYLNELNLKSQLPAWLMLAKDGTLSRWGGNLDYYGISGLRAGAPAAEQLRFLVGLLPVENEPIELPFVQTDSGIFADIHVFTAFSFDWVLIIDTTSHALEYRRMQQRGNELSLRSYDEARARTQEILADLFTGLEVIALEVRDDGSLKLASGLPEWTARIHPVATSDLTRAALVERFPSLDNFLTDAEEFWKNHQPGRLKSPSWAEPEASGEELYLGASALRLGNNPLLLIGLRHH
ncbi:MAG TPA: hypothetical protein VFD58_35965 [Blastocatellia bacterium]|nr:hypothetical protein [Blastocatellia bacterium]